MRDNTSLVPRKGSELTVGGSLLVERGFLLADECQEREVAIPEDYCFSFIRRYAAVRVQIGDIPEAFLSGQTLTPHLVNAFDVNKFLEALDRLRIDEGFVLDYVYAFDGHGGEPLIYVRSTDDEPLHEPEEYWERFSLPKSEMLLGEEPSSVARLPYLRHLQFERNAEGFFEFALFCMLVPRFYLYWHSNYNNRKFLLTTNVQRFVADCSPDNYAQDFATLSSFDLSPRIRMRYNSGEVLLACFEMNRGYSFCRIQAEWPSIFKGVTDEIIIKNRTYTMY